MTPEPGQETGPAGVGEYRNILQRVLETRPSGTRQRIAAALSKNRSFVTQITSPAYHTPIPARHVDLILEICRFSGAERQAFLAAYQRAHPSRRMAAPSPARLRPHTIYLPDLGEPERNRQMDAVVADFVQKLSDVLANKLVCAKGGSMKKLINQVDRILSESLAGFTAAHSDILELGAEGKFVRRRELKPGKVGLISGGGSGHEPLHAGFVGHGMLDAACPGQVFTSPTPDQMLAAGEAVNTGAGLLFIVKNYEGDVMNFDMAAEMAGDMGTEVAIVTINDDVAVEDSTYTTGRRGVAGTMIVEKIVGAAAEAGMALPELKALGERVNRRTRSMGVALTSCTVPAAGKPTFALGEDEMEMGVGIHGEPGRRRVKLKDADGIADEMISAMLDDFGGAAAGEVLLLVNGFGATPAMELYLMYHAARGLIERRGLAVARSLVGNYVTSLDMAGCSLTLLLLDDEFGRHWDAPVHTAGLRWGL